MRFYPLGHPIDLESDTDHAWTAARDAWGGGERRFEAAPVRIRVQVRNGPRPEPSHTRLTGRPGWFEILHDRINRGVFFPATRSGRLRVHSESVMRAGWFRHELLEALVLAALDTVYFTPLHAACVALGDRAILLCGDSGAGKSCLTYACVRRGWTLVSDDSVHLARSENVVAGHSRVIRLREPARALFPELAGEPSGAAPNGKIAIEIPAEARGYSVARFATPTQVVFLNRRSGPASLGEYVVDSAVSYFLKYLWHADTSDHERRIRAFLASGVERLEYDRPDDAVEMLEELVRRS